MKKYYILLSLNLMACLDPQSRKETTQNLEYHRDDRTHLCYATHNLGFQSGVMTNVPCTAEVEKLLVK